MRVRQICLVAQKLAPVREHFFAVLGLASDFADPGVGKFGLENSVMCLGDEFLEVVAPVEDNTTAGRYLERRKGDGGYMVLVQVDDLAVQRAHVDKLGVRVVWETERNSETGSGRTAAFHMHPRDVGGAILSFDQMWPPESWKWAGPDWEQRPATNVSGIHAVDVQSSDPAGMAERWSKLFDRPVFGNTMQLEEGSIRFVADQDGRGAGVTALDLVASNADAAFAAAKQRGLPVNGDEIEICGTTIRMR